MVIDDSLLLLLRGTRAHPLSALIELSLAEVRVGLDAQAAFHSGLRHVVRWVDLGAMEGVALSITDGAILADYLLVVSAVAEHSADSSVDGPCLGAAIAVLDRGGRVLQLHEVQPIFKIEGVHAWLENGQIQLLMVTDADDENTPS